MDVFPYKVELHVHLDGAMRLSTLMEIARENGIKLQANSEEELRKNISVYHAKSLFKVLASFEIFMPIVAGNKKAISRMAYEFCEDCAQNNIKYVEARYSPQLLANNEEKPEYALQHGDLTPRHVVQLINESFKKGMADFKIRVKSILCVMRHRPDWAEEIVDMAIEFRTEGVVAVDIAGASRGECVEDIHPRIKIEFKRAKDAGVHITAHAGEVGPARIVKETLDELYAERIGHGYHTLDDLDIYKEVLQRKIHLETCPISSIRTGAVPEDVHLHPVVRFATDGANFSVNSDDPLVFHTCLADDYSAAMEGGLTRNQIIQGIFNAANSSFASDEERQKILKELEEVYGPQP